MRRSSGPREWERRFLAYSAKVFESVVIWRGMACLDSGGRAEIDLRWTCISLNFFGSLREPNKLFCPSELRPSD